MNSPYKIYTFGVIFGQNGAARKDEKGGLRKDGIQKDSRPGI